MYIRASSAYGWPLVFIGFNLASVTVKSSAWPPDFICFGLLAVKTLEFYSQSYVIIWLHHQFPGPIITVMNWVFHDMLAYSMILPRASHMLGTSHPLALTMHLTHPVPNRLQSLTTSQPLAAHCPFHRDKALGLVTQPRLPTQLTVMGPCTYMHPSHCLMTTQRSHDVPLAITKGVAERNYGNHTEQVLSPLSF